MHVVQLSNGPLTMLLLTKCVRTGADHAMHEHDQHALYLSIDVQRQCLILHISAATECCHVVPHSSFLLV